MPATLPISNLISVSVSLATTAAQPQNLSSLLILTADEVIDVVARMRAYSTLAQVSTDFGTSSPAYLAAQAWFGQNPQPNQLLIGRWAQTASHGRLLCGLLPTAQQAIPFWTAISTGSLRVTIDGGAVQNLSGLNFTGVTNLNGVASIIQAALTGATVVYNSVFNRFEFQSNSTGATSTVSFLSATGSGVDISASLQGQSNSGGYVANGIVAESATAAVTFFDTTFGQQWYGLLLPTGVSADHQAVAAYIEGSSTKHYHGVTTQDSNTLSSASTTDLAYLLSQSKYKKTAIQYSSTSAYAAASLLARILTTNWQGNNTAITLMWKQEPGIVAENLNQTQLSALTAKNCNVFVGYNNSTAIIQNGVSSSGDFTDTIIGADALAINLQTNTYNLLYLSPTKVPQTDQGMAMILTVIEQTCSQFVQDGFLAPGVWTSAGFGSLNTNDYLPKGYYAYAPPVATQSAASRASRLSVPFQIAAKLAGAVHTVSLSITINP